MITIDDIIWRGQGFSSNSDRYCKMGKRYVGQPNIGKNNTNKDK